MKKLFAFVLLSFAFVGCFMDSSPSQVLNDTRLKVANTANLKRIVVTDPINKVTAIDSSQGYDVVDVLIGDLTDKEYSFDYYLKSTNEDIILDSVTFTDSNFSIKSNTAIKGMVVGKEIGFTGDGKITVYTNNTTRTATMDSIITMVVYGKNSVTDSVEKLVVNFKVSYQFILHEEYPEIYDYVNDSSISRGYSVITNYTSQSVVVKYEQYEAVWGLDTAIHWNGEGTDTIRVITEGYHHQSEEVTITIAPYSTFRTAEWAQFIKIDTIAPIKRVRK